MKQDVAHCPWTVLFFYLVGMKLFFIHINHLYTNVLILTQVCLLETTFMSSYLSRYWTVKLNNLPLAFTLIIPHFKSTVTASFSIADVCMFCDRCMKYTQTWDHMRRGYVWAMTQHQKKFLRAHRETLFNEHAQKQFGGFDYEKIMKVWDSWYYLFSKI